MAARLLVVDDDASIRDSIAERFRARGFTVFTAVNGSDALTKIRRESPDVVLLDLQMPANEGGDGLAVLRRLREEGSEVTVVVLTAFGTVERAVAAMREGAWDFLQKPFEPALVEECVRRALERTTLRRAARARDPNPEIVGLAGAVETARKAAKSDATVLLLGESGTGKDVLAQAIHGWSPRGNGPFVAVNAAAIVETLLESELFGHERGAFTGADRRRAGKFELAHGGTLFLDEIGDISVAMQAKLLRVLETREIERVGGDEPVSVDVRIVAATNRDLDERVKSGAFRADLFYRLNVVPITIAPLRERRADIRTLAQHFLARSRPSWNFTSDALGALERYDWPGNARELRNVVERAVALADGPELDVVDLAPEILSSAQHAPTSFHGRVETFRAQLLRETLARCGGNQTRAAEALGLQRTYFARLLKQMRVGPDAR